MKAIPIQAEEHVVLCNINSILLLTPNNFCLIKTEELQEPIIIQNTSRKPEVKKQGCTGCAIM